MLIWHGMLIASQSVASYRNVLMITKKPFEYAYTTCLEGLQRLYSIMSAEDYAQASPLYAVLRIYRLFISQSETLLPLIPYPAIPHDGIHSIHLLLHVFCQGDLAARSHHVVLRIIDLEILVTRDVVIQESSG